ncbi:hydrogenase maturation factor HoxX-like [Mya arenaria]|uniref:hydrogenase maturation factor HoxX-like n=1 Tax=Mya arenaria TaxID=6604 RepID=UPI0022E04BF6|nr:hydrogenase maturation factor HoxX-like [Mya arenaria]
MKFLIPRPGILPVSIRGNLRVLSLNQAVNSLSRRIEDGLRQAKVDVTTVETSDGDEMVSEVQRLQPDLILCPFMKTRIPKVLYADRSRPCLVVHPGIAADRGACSIDWTIFQGRPRWGVTVLEANDEMDGGAIWSCDSFPVPDGSTKSSLYNGAVADAAVRCTLDAVSRFSQHVDPMDKAAYPDLFGLCTETRNMKHSDRRVDWNTPAEDVVRRVRMSDTSPGAIGLLEQHGDVQEWRLFDAHAETGRRSKILKNALSSSRPGTPIATKNGAVLISTAGSSGVWIGQMKRFTQDQCLKLPSSHILPVQLPLHRESCDFEEIKVVHEGEICYVYFDFYNGAMDTTQAVRLQEVLSEVAASPHTKVIALMGGERFFSTGIHLCVMQNSVDKQKNAWANINAINDVIKSVFTMKDKTTVAVLRGNAGAGGAMLATACDLSVAHPGVCVTPTYKSMNLHGSEYWTYFLPEKVGQETAKRLVESVDTLTARQAHEIGLIDHVINVDKIGFHDKVKSLLHDIAHNTAHHVIQHKMLTRTEDWFRQLARHREYELSHMKMNFQSSEFLNAMHDFVFKVPPKRDSFDKKQLG